MPLTIPDQNIALQSKAPDSMNTLGSMMNIANGAQQFQASQIKNESEKATLQERNNVRSLFQNPKDMMDEQGNIDFNKAAPAIMSAAPTQGGSIITSLIGAQNQSIQTKKEVNALSADQRAQVGQFAMSLGGDSPEVGMAKFDAFIGANPGLKTMGAFAKTHLLQPSMNNPAAWQQATLKIGQSVMSPDSQRTAMTPSGVGVSNNQQSAVVNTNPMAPGGVGQVIPGTAQQQQLPPTATTMNGNTPGYLGPQPAQGTQWLGEEPKGKFTGDPVKVMRDIQDIKDPTYRAEAMRALQNQMGAAFPGNKPAAQVQSGPALGQGASAEGTASVINKHYERLVSSAQTASQDIGVLQNIIQHAKGAAVGVTGDREALIAGLAGRLGMTSAELTKTDTDLLAKNSNMLALAGGDTNLAKTLAGAANPNAHMTESAIRQAAYQVMGQKQMDVAAQKLFAPHKELADHGTPEPYNAVLTKFNGAADPRIMQLQYMTPEEKAKMKHSMSPVEQKKFREDISTLESLGVVSKQ